MHDLKSKPKKLAWLKITQSVSILLHRMFYIQIPFSNKLKSCQRNSIYLIIKLSFNAVIKSTS